uniref:1-aminocyclopropane-1-carboxylate deaminase/D-cysteine desulfhydrase n=1 Tax=Thaumasiovibrio occultus TaxID=1891184 RepID=UPI000B356384|nr:1-aminocyclopropane-1-carboxylate deaminase/D-cysteine desulfhydrase [Thaumasiovibrio occultus]
MKIAHSPVTQHTFECFDFYLKRDDLLHPQFSGNKARKFAALLELPPNSVTKLIGYGSVQANSLHSLAALAHLKAWQLDFYVDRLPDWLAANPIGNYRAAMELGVTIKFFPTNICDDDKQAYLEALAAESDALFVPEGGRCDLAELGVKQLAEEIIQWQQTEGLETLTVALPAGTGTTSAYLAKHLASHNIEVITCACVGGSDYLIQQMHTLIDSPYPTILELPRKHHFGKLYRDDLAMWQQIKQQTGVTFDLLYDPLMWHCLRHHYPDGINTPLLYIHQGGLLGNESLLPRYRRKYPELAQ